MARYFFISHGLRGAFADTEGYFVRVKSRRELKAHIADEAERYRDAGYYGASKRMVSWLAATAWREAQKPRRLQAYLPFVLPLRPEHSDSYCFGIFCSTATRAEFLTESEQ